MKVVGTAAFIALWCAGAAFAECGTSETSTPPVKTGSVGPCTWYREWHCCNFNTSYEDTFNEQIDGECKRLSEWCREMRELLACGVKCSADQSEWTDKSGKVKVCKELADRIYGACKGDEQQKPNSDATSTKVDCVKVGEEWKDGTEMMQGLSYDVADDTEKCLNAASPLMATAVAFPAALLALSLL
jgi:Folate receptor family